MTHDQPVTHDEPVISEPPAVCLPDGESIGHNRVRIITTTDDLPGHALRLAGDGYRLALVAAHDDGSALRAVYLYLAPNDRRVELQLPVATTDPRVPSLARICFAAGRFEREMHDLYGINPVDHPLPRRLVRHATWPSGWHPMRRDAGPRPEFTTAPEADGFLTVEGPGVYEIPVGPVHAGMIEPGHFRFSVVGETILKLKARLWYVHRGVEKLFERKDLTGGVGLAERISGDTAVGHTLAYCRAIEDSVHLDVPIEAKRIRAVLLELERLYNHVGDLGALCNDVGYGILNAHALRIRERLLRLNAATTGHRLLRGGVMIGGAAIREVPDPAVLAEIAADIRDIVRLTLDNSMVIERFTGTATLGAQQARDLGTLGYVARASGVDADARRDHPSGVLAGLGAADGGEPGTALGDVFTVPTQTGGDVLARFQQRASEIDASFALLDALIPTVSPGVIRGWPTVNHRPPGLRGCCGVGIVEGWRGTIVHRVEVDPDYALTRNKIVDPSFFNWPALPVSLANTIVPDFPLANKSFNLSYAGNDL